MAFLAASPSRRYSNKRREEKAIHIISDLRLDLMKQEIKMTRQSWLNNSKLQIRDNEENIADNGAAAVVVKRA